MERNRYFRELYVALTDIGLKPEGGSEWRIGLESSFKKLKLSDDIILALKREHFVPFFNSLLVHNMISVLLCKFLNAKFEPLNARGSVLFTLLGCVLDNMLDNGTELQKKDVLHKLSRPYRDNYFTTLTPPLSDSCSDLMFAELSIFFDRLRKADMSRYEFILDKINTSADSEICTINGICSEKNILDKSVLFTEISCEMLFCNTKLDDDDRGLFNAYSYILTLIDDLCDYYSDLDRGYSNLLNYMEGSQSDKIKKAVSLLNEKLEYFRNNTNTALYDVLKGIAGEWMLGCDELRGLIWQI